MRFLKEKKGIIISFILGVILASSITAYALTNASDITYTRTGTNISNVEQALNDLYTKQSSIEAVQSKIISEGSITDNYTCTKKGKLIITMFSCKGQGGNFGNYSCKKNNTELTQISYEEYKQDDVVYRKITCYSVDVLKDDVIDINLSSTGGWGDNGYSICYVY